MGKINLQKPDLQLASLDDYPAIENMWRYYVYDMGRYCGFIQGWECPIDLPFIPDDLTNAVKGFAEKSTLPEKSKTILTTSNPEHVVTFSYCFGSGGVVYSTIPLDVQAEVNAQDPVLKNIKEVYAPNVVSYGAHANLCN